ncbi:hypothetical protein DQ04_19871000, partial [Trypanosoma grayi]|uniref:hypothetical protein n=1 Tax=Trypanosoma grayi TaxID=71804 RepID=UPI0004F3F891
VKQPVCVASLYCGVWDAAVENYTELKALLTLMRSNCEAYNGVGSRLAAECRELVRVGYRAARDAQTDEERDEAEEGGLVIPPALLLDLGAGGGGIGAAAAAGGGCRMLAPLS